MDSKGKGKCNYIIDGVLFVLAIFCVVYIGTHTGFSNKGDVNKASKTKSNIIVDGNKGNVDNKVEVVQEKDYYPGNDIIHEGDMAYLFGGYQSTLDASEGYVTISVVVEGYSSLSTSHVGNSVKWGYPLTFRVKEGGTITLGTKNFEVKKINLKDNRIVLRG